MATKRVERSEDFRRWGAAAWVSAGLAIGIAVWYGLRFMTGFFGFGRVETQDQTRAWPTFYATEFSSYFWIPPEAQIVRATQEKGFMYERQSARFSLPETRSPEAWVALIAQSSGIGRFRQDDLWYDASHRTEFKPNKHRDTITDSYSIRFDPKEKLFEAVWSWD